MRREIVRITDGEIEVEILPELGARIHRLRAFGIDVLRTPDDPETHVREPILWGGYVMAPWCNRIVAARTAIAGREVHLAANHSDGSVLHGQVLLAPWSLHGDGRLVARAGGDGWPWRYETSLRATPAESCLTIDQRLTNLDDGPMPAGLGLHPWFRSPVDVRIDADLVLASNTDPAAELEAVAGDLDLRAWRRMPDAIDAAWPDPRDPAVELRWRELGLAATLRLQSSAGSAIVAASPIGLGAVAIEPQTHLPQGLRRLGRGEPGALELLAPGATLRLTTEWRFRQTSRDRG